MSASVTNEVDSKRSADNDHDATALAALRRVSIKVAAETLGVHPDTIRRRIYAGDLPAVKIGGQIRIRVSDLDALGEPVISGKVEVAADAA